MTSALVDAVGADLLSPAALFFLRGRAGRQRLLHRGSGRHAPVPARGESHSRPEGFASVQFEVILPDEAASRLLERLEREFLPRYATGARETEIRVLRPQES